MDDMLMTTSGGERSGRITSWRDFEDHFRAAMAMAAAQPLDLALMDMDFGHWPLGQRSVMEAFHQWSLGARTNHCQILAGRYDNFPKQHPLWVAWRATWAHRVQCHQAPEELVSSLSPMLILRGTVGLRLQEPLYGIGVWTREPGTLAEWHSEFDVILQRSEPAVPPTNLGL